MELSDYKRVLIRLSFLTPAFLLVALSLVFVLAVPSLAQTTDSRPVILVADFTIETGDEQWKTVGIGLSNSISTKLCNISSIRVVDDESRFRALNEQRYSESGCVDDKTAVILGQLTGASHTIYGTYTLIGDELWVYSYLVDCSTAIKIGACEARAKDDATSSIIGEITRKTLEILGAKLSDAENDIIGNNDVGNSVKALELRGKVEQILYGHELFDINADYQLIDIPKDQLLLAKGYLEQLLSLEPENVVAFMYMGTLYGDSDRLDDFDLAIGWFNKALNIDPNCVSAHLGLGAVYNNKGEYDAAIAEYRIALGIDPDFVKAYLCLGYMLAKEGDLDGGIDKCKMALGIDPNSARAYVVLGVIQARKGDYDSAIEEYRQAISIDPSINQVYILIGLAFYRKGDMSSAITSYKEALAINPNLASAHSCIGLALEAIGDIDDAITEYRMAIQVDPDYSWAWVYLGLVYFDKGDYTQARYCFNESIRCSSPGEREYQIAIEYLAKM